MVNQIHLFIEGREVEFKSTPSILYNYKETDLSNPAIVKNSFSKTVEIEGTNANNDIFGQIWCLEREQEYGDYGGPSFDPTKKADFKLYVNGDLYEAGYCKLVNIKKENGVITYGITLFGGIGSFFQSLHSRENDEEKFTLADLRYGTDLDVDLDFEITKDAVDGAWHRLAGDSEYGEPYRKWDYINFAVTSEGVPDNFDANKILVNPGSLYNPNPNSGTSGYSYVYNSFLNPDGYSLWEFENPQTMDTTFDLRSYLLRPVVSVFRIFEAIKDPYNNGGWEVFLDDHFFSSQNPYYTDAWMTLPRIPELNITPEDNAYKSGSLVKDGTNYYDVEFTKGNSNNASITFTVSIDPTTTPASNDMFLSTAVDIKTARMVPGKIDVYRYSGTYVIVLQALNENNEVVAEGTPIALASNKNSYSNGANWWTSENNWLWKYGHIAKRGNKYMFVDFNGDIVQFTTRLNGYANWTKLRLKVINPLYSTWSNTGIFVANWDYDYSDDLLAENRKQLFYFVQEEKLEGNYTLDDIKYRNYVEGDWKVNLVSINAIADNYESFLSGALVRKEKLLKTDFSVADFLLSYAKLFGLYFYYDPTEIPSAGIGADKGVIHIMDRDSFFTDEVVDINELIDRKKPINITPRTMQTKWYSFNYNDGEGESEGYFKKAYGYAYGRQLVNTESNFDSETTDVYQNCIFKNGVMVQEKCNTYFLSNGLNGLLTNRFTHQSYKEGTNGEFDTLDTPKTSVKKGNNVTALNNDDLLFYDVFPKLQIHKEENGSANGAGILLFYDGMRGVNSPYYISDDVADMRSLNNNTPCWLMSIAGQEDAGGFDIVVTRNTLPFFTRDIYDAGVNGNIVNSWNLGHPQETYVPRTASTDGDSIYDKCWKDYISDIYSNNARIVKASMLFKERPTVDWLRRFYWWDNAIWKMNAILDWNINSYDTTEVEFIKVIDTEDYKLNEISYFGGLQIILSTDTIGNNGGTITGQVKQQMTTDTWGFEDPVVARYAGGTDYFDLSDIVSPTTGTGAVTNITITVPANPRGVARTFELLVYYGGDNQQRVYFTQAGDNSPILQFSPSTYTVGAASISTALTYTYANLRPGIQSTASANWIIINSVGNGQVYLGIASNTGASRTGTVTLTASGENGTTLTTTATITQQSGGISVSPSSLTFDYDRTSSYPGKTFTITSNGSWTITTSDS